MPSGAKKRKAAKRKKEKETNTNPSTNNPKGDNELKSQDEKGSNGGSPAHRDHDHHQFIERSEEVEERDTAAAAVAVAVAKPLAEVPNHSKKIDEAEGGKEGGVVIEWDMKSEESWENKDVSSVHIEPSKESNYRNGNSGSSIDETITVKNSRDEPRNLVKETAAFDVVVNSVKETVNPDAESSADLVNVVTSVSEMKSRVTGDVLLEKSLGSQVGATDLAMKRNEDKVRPFPDEDVRTSSLEEPETKEFDSKVSSSMSHSLIPRSTNGAEHVKDCDTPECSENQPHVASAPHMVQKTSWLSCCGLFEVLSGSNR